MNDSEDLKTDVDWLGQYFEKEGTLMTKEEIDNL